MSSAPTSVKVGIGAFVFRSSNEPYFLLGKRQGSLGAGSYALAGGHLELGETFEQCAAREVREETGLEVRDVEFLTAVNSLFTSRDGSDGERLGVVEKHYVTVFMSCVVDEEATRKARGVDGDGEVEPENLEPHKCDGWEWRTLAQMRDMAETGSAELFLPLNVLLQQRPKVCQMLECWGLIGSKSG